jgi:putative ABC transport system permease protein
MNAQAKNVKLINQAVDEISKSLRETHSLKPGMNDDFRVRDMGTTVSAAVNSSRTMSILLASVGIIVLLVGGIGIMNIMYVTVSERTPEIGLRKALGATYRDIVSQFLVESILITVWGSLIGIIFGLILSWVLSLVANHFGIVWHFIIPWSGIVTAIVFSLTCGLLFGLRPAQKAAQLDPVEALRAE